jgi:hypothetical protein
MNSRSKAENADFSLPASLKYLDADARIGLDMLANAQDWRFAFATVSTQRAFLFRTRPLGWPAGFRSNMGDNQ